MRGYFRKVSKQNTAKFRFDSIPVFRIHISRLLNIGYFLVDALLQLIHLLIGRLLLFFQLNKPFGRHWRHRGPENDVEVHLMMAQGRTYN